MQLVIGSMLIVMFIPAESGKYSGILFQKIGERRHIKTPMCVPPHEVVLQHGSLGGDVCVA